VIDIEKIKPEIINCLKSLEPDKIILFGSYAYGTPTDESDIDLFLLKDNLKLEEIRDYEIAARKSIRDLIFKYKTGFDILSAPTEEIIKREEYFYKVDILQNGIVLYE
jgi:uncharacterized protein